MPEITEGIHHGMPNDAYHAATGWWSSSQLKGLLPEYYKPVARRQPVHDWGVEESRRSG